MTVLDKTWPTMQIIKQFLIDCLINKIINEYNIMSGYLPIIIS